NSYLSNIGSLENIQSFEKYLKDNKEPNNGNVEIDNIVTIELKNVNLSYDTIKVLDRIDLKITQNESVAFVGESGAGKTTLVNVICSLLSKDEIGRASCRERV